MPRRREIDLAVLCPAVDFLAGICAGLHTAAPAPQQPFQALGFCVSVREPRHAIHPLKMTWGAPRNLQGEIGFRLAGGRLGR